MKYRKGRTQDIMDEGADVILLRHKSLPTKLVKFYFHQIRSIIKCSL